MQTELPGKRPRCRLKRTKSLIAGVAPNAAQLEVLTLLTRRCDRPGNSAVIGLRAVRPEALRPRLSASLLFGEPGDAAPRAT